MPLDLSVFQQAAEAFEKKHVSVFTSLSGSSGTLLFSLIREPCLLLCPSEASAAGFYSDAVFWSKMLDVNPPVCVYPEGQAGRAASLVALYEDHGRKFIASVDAALSPLWEKDRFPSFTVTRGLAADREDIVEHFQKMGYHHVPIVSGEGEMSVRGGILDIYPPDRENPVRMEFFGDEIESLRFFDIESQLSVKEIHDITVHPCTPPDEGPDLLDFLSASRLILQEPDDINRHYPDMNDRLRDREAVVHFTALSLSGEGMNTGAGGTGGFGLLPQERKDIDDFVVRTGGLSREYFILMVCSSEGQAKRLKELFFDHDIDIPVTVRRLVAKETRSPAITIGELGGGFRCRDTLILTERDIFGRRPQYRPVKKSRVSKLMSSIEDIRPGDYLVHAEHGIGRFTGISKERIEDQEDDFITIEYLGGDKLFVPLERINYVQKYHAPEHMKPRVDKLGGKTWQKTKHRVKRKVKDMAEHLLKIYAGRTSMRGIAFSADTELHREFDGFFPYEETPDQLTAISEIKYDMESPVPMDRLLCGDVGYGKTEVVMRACFKAVYDSRQAAVLVPTTILAEQHYETFRARFSAFPVKIDYLSRFKSGIEKKRTLGAIAGGETDIVIGTHALLGGKLNFHNLGLLVIDEEHKFGVAHKEKIKALRSNVDVLSLSATPIPRTLHMAMSGIRGMSVIETPPEERLAVQGVVARFNPEMIREALFNERDRNGQAFFVHNRIRDIYKMGNYLSGLVPGSKIGVAHGQMKERELEKIMRDFYHGEIDVLVSTAIIGSGLDIPSANTIIINRADMFGLADLYQLRGRVGRSNVRAYAYFLIPGEDSITEEARKKLQAIQELGYLGAGFRLAIRDLEIRGAGNLLGAEQSGHIEAVGFDMYMEMLEAAVAELKGERPAPKIEPVMDMRTTALIPDDYIEIPDLRLSVYRKIASAKDESSLQNMIQEMRDRFGEPPEKARKLIDIMELKVMAKKLLITKIENASGRFIMLFDSETPVTSEKLFSLYNERKGRLRFLPEGGIELDLRGRKWHEVCSELRGVMDELGAKDFT